MRTANATSVRRPVRRAGRADLDGATVTWTVADGSKGRRWREVLVRGGAIVHSLLLETFPDGRFAHLELSTPAGLLTLHPEGDGTLHGNAVTAGGVRHVRAMPFSASAHVMVESSLVTLAATAHAARIQGAESPIDLVVVQPNLRLTTRQWQVDELVGAADDIGLPTLPGIETWPLELE